MANATFNTPSGQTIERKLLMLFLNTGTTAAPVWSIIGKRVEDSSAEYDWGTESEQDILGNVNTTMKKPTIKQTFDPTKLDSGEAAYVKLWELAVRDQDVSALSNLDMLMVHAYVGAADAFFAERYDGCAAEVQSLGGDATVDMPFDVTFGGKRTTGTAAIAAGQVTFTEAA
jgi:hypothetical protein